LEPIAQRGHARAVGCEVGAGSRSCGAKAGDSGDVFSAGPRATLLAATADQRRRKRDSGIAPDQRTNALRGPDLVSRNRHKIRFQYIDIEWDFSVTLDRIHVQERACRMSQARDLRNRLNNAGLVVGMHHRNQRTVAKDCEPALERLELDLASAA